MSSHLIFTQKIVVRYFTISFVNILMEICILLIVVEILNTITNRSQCKYAVYSYNDQLTSKASFITIDAFRDRVTTSLSCIELEYNDHAISFV